MTNRAEPVSPIRVYNTMSKIKEPFVPVRPGKVGIYLCGPTVYKPSHIGHMVGPVIFDAVKRYLVYNGFDVTLVINITDVDDKLIVESNKVNKPMKALAEEMTADYMRNLDAMGVDTVDHFPRATDNMDEIIKLTETLIDKGYAYAADGDVYFDVAKDAEYGKLTHRSLESMLGDGGEMAGRKRSSADFALWKSAKPGEPSWPSPWGAGRPGWHIECSAMSRRLLGETFDIHGGGLDLMFPHHENEVAQSECCHGKPQAKYWMHNGLMQASSEVGKVGGRNTRESDAPPIADQAAQEAGKMGKSKGASAFSDLLKKFQPESIRFFLLSTQYRRPIDYSEERVLEVEKGLETFYRFFARYQRIFGQSFYELAAATRRADGEVDAGQDAMLKQVKDYRQRFLESMDDDFNTGGAIGLLFDLLRTLNKFADDTKIETAPTKDPVHLETFKRGSATLRELTGVLGLFRKPIEKRSMGDDALVGKLLELFIAMRADLRAEAKQSKNKALFAMSDKIRTSLAELGVILEDRPGGTDWTIQR